MKTQHTIIAMAVSALFAVPAFASDNDCESCNSATSSVEISQTIEYADVTNEKVENTAEIDDNFMKNAEGNIGVNMGVGTGNQQANAASISDAEFCFNGAANASIDIDQTSKHNDVDNNGATNIASLEDNAMKRVSGNVGLNMAAGDHNQQTNAMAMANVSVRGSSFANASVEADQKSHGNETENERYRCTNTTNTASLGDNAMQWAYGNVGVNIAAGTGNQQFNGLSLASAKSSQ